jgi:endonuclease G, mitochondrial
MRAAAPCGSSCCIAEKIALKLKALTRWAAPLSVGNLGRGGVGRRADGQAPSPRPPGGNPPRFDEARLKQEVQQRIQETRGQRLKARQAIASGTPLKAEEDWERRTSYVERVKPENLPPGAEAIQGDTVDYVDAVFLLTGTSAARTVARVLIDDGRTPYGSGFMISPKLFITNNHVLIDAESARHARINFNYEVDALGAAVSETTFRLDPDAFFYTVSWESLDFTVVAVGPRTSGSGDLAGQGYCPLSGRPDKHAKGMTVNIVEHPNGWIKKLVVRENRLVARLDQVLHYEADTEPGSSGSPVFNDGWEVVALHHWGEPHLETRSVDGVDSPVTVNEGVRISIILQNLKDNLTSLKPTQAALLQEALNAGDQAEIAMPVTLSAGGAAIMPPKEQLPVMGDEALASEEPSTSTNEAIVVVPLEIRVRVLSPEKRGYIEPSASAGTIETVATSSVRGREPRRPSARKL